MENVNAIEDKNSESTTSVQYIVVKIGNEQYGIDIKYIDNIVSCLLYTSDAADD